jgi:hypothetical protein
VKRSLLTVGLAALGVRQGMRLVAGGAVTIDVGVGRRLRPLGPVSWDIAAPRETVFDVISTPYLGRTPRALAGKLDVWERSPAMVLAAHRTDVKGRTTTTLETVTFDRPARIEFRLVRGPVPHVHESFELVDGDGGGTTLTWAGELGTDFWGAGTWWGDRVARAWERAVRASLDSVRQEAERRARAA